MYTMDPYTGGEIARQRLAELERRAELARLVARLPRPTGGPRAAVATLRGLVAAAAAVVTRRIVAPTA